MRSWPEATAASELHDVPSKTAADTLEPLPTPVCTAWSTEGPLAATSLATTLVDGSGQAPEPSVARVQSPASAEEGFVTAKVTELSV